jgi:hypothetical protein
MKENKRLVAFGDLHTHNALNMLFIEGGVMPTASSLSKYLDWLFSHMLTEVMIKCS